MTYFRNAIGYVAGSRFIPMFSLLIALLLPFLAAALLPLLRGRWESHAGWFALPVPFLSTAALVDATGWLRGATLDAPWILRIPWISELGLDFSLRLDGLSAFFALVVSGVGCCVFAYAIGYFGGEGKRLGRFFAYLCLFLGAMLGTVLSNNLLLLFVFWELTGIASFLLIGFQHAEKAESSRGARMALLTTGAGGVVMLIGVVLLGRIFGTYEIDEILAAGPRGADHPLMLGAFLCCIIGCFTKSAQFPFQYWLPNAMAAPTPVSAYLHSATLVKLGVFLTARLLPVFGDLALWQPLLVVVGFTTLLVGAFLAVGSQDLKAVLAYTTVSQLGLLIGHYGLHSATGGAVAWDTLHTLNHVFYKACLFMVVGIIDHSTGTRDLRHLGGLGKRMPWTALAAAVALASMAGVPFTTGFISKELLLKTLFGMEGGWVLFALIAVVVASLLKVMLAVSLFRRVFLGNFPPRLGEHFHGPGFGVQSAPLLLAGAAVFFGSHAGLFAGLQGVFDGSLQSWMSISLFGLLNKLSPELMLSLAILAVGLVLGVSLRPDLWNRATVPGWAHFDRLFDAAVDGLPKAGKGLLALLAADRPSRHIPIMLVLIVVAMSLAAVPSLSALVGGWEMRGALPAGLSGYARWILLAVAAVGIAALLRTPSVPGQILALSIIGAVVTLFFGFYHAPDLALTQILVESASLLLIMLIVFRLRRGGVDLGAVEAPVWGRAALAVLSGVSVAILTLLFQSPDKVDFVGRFYLLNSLEGAKGSNAVNTILIDFRGFDTLLEISVLLIAALGCLGLLMRRREDRSAVRRISAGSQDLFPVPRNLVLRTAGLTLFWILNLLAIYLFFRGHNSPGGGFIAGLVTALSLLLLTFIVGVERTRVLVPVNGVVLAVIGVGLAGGTAGIGIAFGDAALQHYHGYTPDLPWVGSLYFGTPMLFDLGVYLTVVGVLLKIVLPLMKSVHGLPAFVADEETRYSSTEDEPIDVLFREGASKEGRGE